MASQPALAADPDLYAGLLAATLLLAAAGGLLTLRSTLYSGLDDSLRAATDRSSGQLTAHITPPAPADEAILDRLNREQTLRLTVFDGQGQEIDWGPSPVGFSAHTGITQAGLYRVYTRRAGLTWVQAAQQDAPVRAALERMERTILLGIFPVLLLAAAAGYLVSDRALKPVDQVSDLAARIAHSGQVGERVPLAPGEDELTRLTRTVNQMLTRLDGLLTRERLFAHASAHELRTPLSIIRGSASLALEQERSPGEYREALAQVRDVSEELTLLTSRLLMLARGPDALALEQVDLADIAVLASEAHVLEAQKKRVRLTLDPASAPVLGDPSALLLAAGNLVQNAVKHAPVGGQVWIGSARQETRATLSVEDDGPGIAPEEIPRLLQPFQRGAGQPRDSGAGLGLALVVAVAEAHSGELFLRRSGRRGLAAVLKLPPLQSS